MSGPSPPGSNRPGHRSRKGAQSGAWIVFADEAGAGLTGAWSRTWAPVGQRPVLHVVKGRPVKMSMAAVCCYRRGHVSRMLSRTRPGWYRDRDLVAFLDGVHRVLGAPVILVWGNLAAHRSGRMRAAIEARKWLEVEYLPSYAPELNPVEQACSHLKGTGLANLAALSFTELSGAVRSGLRRLRYRPDLLDGFLAHTGLQVRNE